MAVNEYISTPLICFDVYGLAVSHSEGVHIMLVLAKQEGRTVQIDLSLAEL